MRVRLYEHPMRPEAQVFEAPSIGEWLLEHYGDSPQVMVQVFAGEPSAEAEITGNVEALMRNDRAEYVVLESPGSDPIFWLQVISAVISVASILMAPDPQMPDNVNRTQQSANNSLGSRSNQVRQLQRVEDIYGTVKAIPSLMMPSYAKYIDNRKVEYGYYCISRGYLDVEKVSDGDTLLANITGSSAAVYAPFTSPNGSHGPQLQVGPTIIDTILTVARSNQIDGVTLRPINELLFAPDASYYFYGSGSVDIIQQVQKAPNFNSLLTVGDEIVIELAGAILPIPVGTEIVDANSGTSTFRAPSGGGFFSTLTAGLMLNVTSTVDPTNNGVYTITGTDGDALITVSPAPATRLSISTTFEIMNPDIYSGTRTVAGVGDGLIELTGSHSWGPLDPNVLRVANITLVQDDPPTEYTDWVTLVAADRTQVWVNIVAPRGLYKDSGGRSSVTVEFELEIQKLNPVTFAPTTPVEIVTSSLSGSVSDEVADTIEHVTAWVGPARVRMRRTGDHDFEFKGLVVDEIKWQDLYSVSPVTKSHFGNKTTIHTITPATPRSTAVKERQLNCIASRLIPRFYGSSFSGEFNEFGRLVSGTIHRTSKLVDIIAAVSIDRKIGQRDLNTEVDMPQLYAVQRLLDNWHPACGQFNYTFDSDNTSFEETVQMIANAGFCIAYRQNGMIRLALDRAQLNSTALFTHHNKRPHAETITRKFVNDADYDGVEFVYSDPDTQQSETIKLPLDGGATKAQKFEIPGIRSFEQAWYRANREYAKLLGQRINIETSTTMDARSLLPNARVDIVDNTRFKSYDGEVVAQAGLLLTLSREVQFDGGQGHSILLMRRNGSFQSIPVTRGPEANQVLLAYAPSQAIVTEATEDGIRTIFSFGPDDARAAQAYLVQEIDLSDPQYPVVRAVNYSADYYAADEIDVPDKAPIIN